MDKKKSISRIALIMAACLFLSGCTGNIPFINKDAAAQEEIAVTVETLGLEPDFSYERKAERPSIQVNRLGYLPKSVKTAIFQGKELPENFRIIEKTSRECVYEGEIRLKKDAADSISTGYGIFTDLEQEGDYYVECDKIGCSYYFSIQKEIYLEEAKELGGLIEEAGRSGIKENLSRKTEDICETISCLLVAYEMYPELFVQIWKSENAGKDTGETAGEPFFRMLRRETDKLLLLQDEKTGGIYRDGEAALKAVRQGLSEEATAAFAGAMAKYSYLYQEYDWDYANTCLKAAAKAWRYLNSASEKNIFGKFYAASELYRASNETLYHNYILQNQALLFSRDKDFYLLMGKVTYLSTRRTVEDELCRLIMNELMWEAESIALRTKKGLFLVEQEETDAILQNMTVMALANYAIMNYEYVTVIENHMHYLLGRNQGAEFMLKKQDSVEAARALLLLSVVEAEKEIIEASESAGK